MQKNSQRRTLFEYFATIRRGSSTWELSEELPAPLPDYYVCSPGPTDVFWLTAYESTGTSRPHESVDPERTSRPATDCRRPKPHRHDRQLPCGLGVQPDCASPSAAPAAWASVPGFPNRPVR